MYEVEAKCPDLHNYGVLGSAAEPAPNNSVRTTTARTHSSMVKASRFNEINSFQVRAW